MQSRIAATENFMAESISGFGIMPEIRCKGRQRRSILN
jgi:hypothetical protein